MGGAAGWRGLQIKMLRLRASDHDAPQAGGKKYQGDSDKCLKNPKKHVMILLRDMFK